MSAGNACHCGEGKEPLHADGNRPPRLWRVLARYGNRSAFNGYRWTPSAWSCVMCIRCNRVWRTKADYVGALKDATDEDRDRPSANTISIGDRDTRGEHARFMEACGREPMP